ncbi:MAG TPA: hypothetical protein VI318_22265 [Baekduia sp.]
MSTARRDGAPDFASLRVPGEEQARRRALAVARAALEDRPEVRSSAPRLRALTVVVGAVVVVAVVALGLTAPGRAAAEWVGSHLSELTGRDSQPARRATAPPAPYAHLPGGGRLLAVDDQGVFAFGIGPAPRQLLGRVDTAAWSPHGRFAIAVRGIELIAVDLHGRRRWSHAERVAIRWPVWSPSGFRVAYVTGTQRGGRAIHVIAGDGTNPHVLAGSGRTRPVWQPGVAPAERLATVDAANRVVLRDADSGRALWRARMVRAPRALAFTPDGRRLLVLERDRVLTLDAATGRRRAATRRTPDIINIAIAPRPDHAGYALLRRRLAPVRQTEVVLGRSVVLADPGRIRSIAFSPHGDWLAADRAGVDGWDLVHLDATTVDRSRTLAAGRGARLSGWCCG